MGRNADVLREVIARFTSGDVDGVAKLLVEDFQGHIPGDNQLSGTYKGRDEFLRTFFGKVMGLTGGQFKLEAHDYADSDDHAVGIYVLRATRDGNTLEWPVVNVYHLRDGKIAEFWHHPGNFEAWNAFWQ